MPADDKPAGGAAPLVRAYEPRDRDAVRRICCQTAYRNRGADAVFEDLEIHADYWTSYYTDWTPEETLVVEVDGEVVGYFFGCSDHKAYTRVMALRIVPSCLLRGFFRWATGRYRSPLAGRYLRFMVTRAPKEAPDLPVRDYPAHFHFNILPAARRYKLYTLLVLDFLDRLEEKGIHGIHGHMTEPRDKGLWDLFEQAMAEQGLRPHHVAEAPTAFFKELLDIDTPMVNRGWALSTDLFRALFVFLREKKGF